MGSRMRLSHHRNRLDARRLASRHSAATGEILPERRLCQVDSITFAGGHYARVLLQYTYFERSSILANIPLNSPIFPFFQAQK